MDRSVKTRKGRQWSQAFSSIVFMGSLCSAESQHLCHISPGFQRVCLYEWGKAKDDGWCF